MSYKVLADIIWSFHVFLTVFIVGGLVAVKIFFADSAKKASTMTSYVLACLATSVASNIIWGQCPLTLAEEMLRNKYYQDQFSYSGSFAAYYLQKLGIQTTPELIIISTITLFIISFITFKVYDKNFQTSKYY